MFATEDTISERTRAWLGRNWKAILGLIVVGALLFLVPVHFGVHFGYIERDKSETMRLIDQFHARMNAGQIDQIYDDASLGLQRSESREAVIGTLRKARDDHGAFENVESSKIEVVMGPPIEIRAVYNSKFEKGDATEWFIFVIEGSDIRLRTYYVQRTQSSSPKAISRVEVPVTSAEC